MKKTIVGLLAFGLVVTALIGAGKSVYAGISVNAYESGGKGYSTTTNTYGSTRYFTNTIYKTSTDTMTDGTSIKTKSGTLSSNGSNTISVSLSSVSYAYGKGVIYRGSAYESGVAVSAKARIR